MRSIVKEILVVLMLSSFAAAAHPDTEKIVNEAKKEIKEMPPQELKKLIDNDASVIVLDIRESEQRAEGEIFAYDTFAITRGNLEFFVPNKIKDKDALIVTYCRGGSRGALAAETLKKMGYKNAVNLKDGLKGWAKAGYPVDTGLGVMKLSVQE